MANFASAATQIAGNALVRTASAIAINQATSYISRAFDNRIFEGPRLDSFRLAGLDMRVYRGTKDQMPDPIIAATEGKEAPAFRGTAYVVFEEILQIAISGRVPNVACVISVMRRGRSDGIQETKLTSSARMKRGGQILAERRPMRV